MATPHIFIVNATTFPLHLQYRFAGTTAGSSRERHIGLLSDIARVRPGDPVIFYQVGYGFYGIFRISDIYTHPYWERKNGWLQDELGMPLIYRVLIEPLEVYKKPVLEWDAVDKLPVYARDVRWSLFYRKLKGERGCSYLFPHEFDSLKELLINNNSEGPIAGKVEPDELTWEKGEIRVLKGVPKKQYSGSTDSPASHINLKAAEIHLQTWITLNMGRNKSLQQVTGTPVWFANEYFTGSGMQKGDILCVEEQGSGKIYRLIELKNVENTPGDLTQLRRYIRWIKSFVLNEGDIMQPIWVSKGFTDLKQAKEKGREIAELDDCVEPQLFTWEIIEGDPVFKQL